MLKESIRKEIQALAVEAGERIMPFFRQAHNARAKADASPVTDADIAAHHHIVAGLKRITPDIPIVSEEDEAGTVLTSSVVYWLVDPLDGTLGFVRGDPEFTVNIGLVSGARAVYGALYAPVQRDLYFGGEGIGAFRQADGGEPVAIRCRAVPAEGATLTRSRSKPSDKSLEFMDSVKPAHVIAASSALKFGWVAEAKADIYPRFGRTMEWDTAAGQAIIEAAGGSVTTLDGAPLGYGKPGFENPAFIVRGL